jgi:hypothetical protein
MWNSKLEESQHEIIEDDNSSHSSTPSDERLSEFNGYVDRHGNPNPLYVSSSNDDTKDGPNNNKDDDRSYESILTQQRRRNQRRLNGCIDFLSDLSFFFGSFMYLWLALSESKDVLIAKNGGGSTTPPVSIDANGNSQFSFDHGTTTGGQHTNTKAGWYLQDKVVFGSVTLYMVYGLTASILIVAAGSLRLYTARTPSDRVPYAFMVFASSLAMVSSSLVSLNTFWSNACFSVAIHWYALQAATLLLWRSTSSSPSSRRSYLRLSGDALFLLATLGGIALSYLYLFDATHIIAFSHEYLAISVAGVWFSASFVYLLQTICALIHQRSTHEDEDDCESSISGSDNNDDEDKLPKSLPQDDTESTSQDDVEKANSDGELVEEKVDYRGESTKNQIGVGIDDDGGDSKTNEGNDHVKNEEEKSVFTTWTDGPGPSNNEHITKSSLDVIFGTG